MAKAKQKIYLVTGATGFLGSALVEELVGQGHRVIGIGRREEGFLSSQVRADKNFSFRQLDLLGAVGPVLNEFQFDGIFHLASQQPTFTNIAYDDYYRGNVETTQTVINYAASHKVPFVVLGSTVAFLRSDKARKKIDENSQPAPANYYELTKYISEQLMNIGLRKSTTKAVVVRFPSLFGRNHLGGLVYTYYQLAKEGRDIEIYGNGRRMRSFLYVDDAVDILLSIAKNVNKLEPWNVFTAGGKSAVATKELAGLIKDIVKSNSKILCNNKPIPNEENVSLDISKSRQVLKFDPQPLANRLRTYVERMSDV